MKTKHLIVSIVFVLSFMLAACGEANRRPTVDVNLSSTFLETPGTVTVDVVSSDNSWGSKPTSCTWSVQSETARDMGAEPAEMPIDTGTWTGYVMVNETTIVTATCENEAGKTSESQTLTVANPRYGDTAQYQNGVYATMENACVGSFGKETKIGTKNYNGAVVINLHDAMEGFSLEASRSYVTNITSLNGYTIPESEEMLNDALQVQYCEKNGKIFIYVFDRDLSLATPYNVGSYYSYSTTGGITLHHDDVNHTAGWYGTPSGTFSTYYQAHAFNSWDEAYASFGDELGTHFDAIQRLVVEIKAGHIVLHDHMFIPEGYLWVQ